MAKMKSAIKKRNSIIMHCGCNTFQNMITDFFDSLLPSMCNFS
jgi:hypothetical protein